MDIWTLHRTLLQPDVFLWTVGHSMEPLYLPIMLGFTCQKDECKDRGPWILLSSMFGGSVQSLDSRGALARYGHCVGETSSPKVCICSNSKHRIKIILDYVSHLVMLFAISLTTN